jgi:hypothetical protein
VVQRLIVRILVAVALCAALLAFALVPIPMDAKGDADIPAAAFGQAGLNFEAMTEQERRSLAQRLVDGSSVFDFDRALELVQHMPAEAERLLRMREERKKRQEELDRAYQRLHLAALEFR